jgi:organic hydroperoxide reductase OsmC/OhrA
VACARARALAASRTDMTRVSRAAGLLVAAKISACFSSTRSHVAFSMAKKLRKQKERIEIHQ